MQPLTVCTPRRCWRDPQQNFSPTAATHKGEMGPSFLEWFGQTSSSYFELMTCSSAWWHHLCVMTSLWYEMMCLMTSLWYDMFCLMTSLLWHDLTKDITVVWHDLTCDITVAWHDVSDNIAVAWHILTASNDVTFWHYLHGSCCSWQQFLILFLLWEMTGSYLVKYGIKTFSVLLPLWSLSALVDLKRRRKGQIRQ